MKAVSGLMIISAPGDIHTLAGVLLLGVGSTVCGITSWVKFARLAGEGRRAVSQGHAFELAPRLHFAADGSTATGLALNYRF